MIFYEKFIILFIKALGFPIIICYYYLLLLLFISFVFI